MSPTSIYSFTSAKLEARLVPEKGGHGLFAVEPISEGELLVVWGGEIRTADQLAEINGGSNVYGVQVEEDIYLWSIEEGDPADYVNHSCNPNGWLSGQISLIARRPIAVGEEVSYDYAMTDASDFDSFECHCGDPLCRGNVTGQDWMRLELQERYAGHFSPYIQRRIDALKK